MGQYIIDELVAMYPFFEHLNGKYYFKDRNVYDKEIKFRKMSHFPNNKYYVVSVESQLMIMEINLHDTSGYIFYNQIGNKILGGNRMKKLNIETIITLEELNINAVVFISSRAYSMSAHYNLTKLKRQLTIESIIK